MGSKQTFTEQEMKLANKTCRDSGAVGANPILLQVIQERYSPNQILKILDYGAGKRAKQTLMLRELGYNVTAHEFGENFNPDIHKSEALSEQYDVVFASNVLNVQSSEDMLDRTLYEISKLIKKSWGCFICNYPIQPRYLNLSNISMQELLKCYFYRVKDWSAIKRLQYSGKVFVCDNI